MQQQQQQRRQRQRRQRSLLKTGVSVVAAVNLEHFVLNSESVEGVDGGISRVRRLVFDEAVAKTLS